jgi:hypothetical protein
MYSTKMNTKPQTPVNIARSCINYETEVAGEIVGNEASNDDLGDNNQYSANQEFSFIHPLDERREDSNKEHFKIYFKDITEQSEAEKLRRLYLPIRKLLLLPILYYCQIAPYYST